MRPASLLVMAGIYEIWRDPAKDRDDESAWLRTCSVITTEATDAVVLVVSEETGQISLVRGGQVFRNLAPADLRARLNEFLFDIAPKPKATTGSTTAEVAA